MFAVLFALISGSTGYDPPARRAEWRDFFGLVVSVLICVYLLYALLRGEKF